MDAVDVQTGKLLARLTDTSKPCCIERIPAPAGKRAGLDQQHRRRDAAMAELSADGQLKSVGKRVGAAPKRRIPPHARRGETTDRRNCSAHPNTRFHEEMYPCSLPRR